MMGGWYYQMQKQSFGSNEKLFLMSIILPIIVSLAAYLLPEKTAIIVNISVNTFVLMIWLHLFRLMGSRISFRDADNTLAKISPSAFLFPIVYYFSTLYEVISGVYVVVVLVYMIVFSYLIMLSTFLPIDEKRRLYIVTGLAALVVANILNSHHTFLERLPWAYPVIRAITIAAKCAVVYGMVSVKVREVEDSF